MIHLNENQNVLFCKQKEMCEKCSFFCYTVSDRNWIKATMLLTGLEQMSMWCYI